MPEYPVTPDGRYFVVKGRLWRRTDPSLSDETRDALVSDLMSARRGVRDAGRAGDDIAKAAARQRVDAAKRALGERGPVWWNDGSGDFNRRMVKNTPYAEWFANLTP